MKYLGILYFTVIPWDGGFPRGTGVYLWVRLWFGQICSERNELDFELVRP